MMDEREPVANEKEITPMSMSKMQRIFSPTL
jgi:hypothetical protein